MLASTANQGDPDVPAVMGAWGPMAGRIDERREGVLHSMEGAGKEVTLAAAFPAKHPLSIQMSLSMGARTLQQLGRFAGHHFVILKRAGVVDTHGGNHSFKRVVARCSPYTVPELQEEAQQGMSGSARACACLGKFSGAATCTSAPQQHCCCMQSGAFGAGCR